MASFLSSHQGLRRGYSMLDELGKGDYGFNQFNKLASGGPGLHDYLSQAAARGGSFAQADAAFQGARRERQGQAYDAYGQFKIGADAQRASLLGQLGQTEENLMSLDFQKYALKKASSQSMLNNILGIGGGLLGMFAGPLAGAVGGSLASKIAPNAFNTMYGTPKIG